MASPFLIVWFFPKQWGTEKNYFNDNVVRKMPLGGSKTLLVIAPSGNPLPDA